MPNKDHSHHKISTTYKLKTESNKKESIKLNRLFLLDTISHSLFPSTSPAHRLKWGRIKILVQAKPCTSTGLAGLVLFWRDSTNF